MLHEAHAIHPSHHFFQSRYVCPYHKFSINNKMSTPKQLGDDLLREKGGVGEGRAARLSERPGVGGGA